MCKCTRYKQRTPAPRAKSRDREEGKRGDRRSPVQVHRYRTSPHNNISKELESKRQAIQNPSHQIDNIRIYQRNVSKPKTIKPNRHQDINSGEHHHPSAHNHNPKYTIQFQIHKRTPLHSTKTPPSPHSAPKPGYSTSMLPKSWVHSFRGTAEVTTQGGG